MHWTTENDRIPGRIIFPPLIAFSDDPDDLTQDIVVIDVEPFKIDPSMFEANFIDLGNELTPNILTDMMYPNAKGLTGPSLTSSGHYCD